MRCFIAFRIAGMVFNNLIEKMVRICKKDGGGWVDEWTQQYLSGHRGLICLMLDVDHIDSIYQSLIQKNINVSQPEWLEFKWFFNLLTRRMPWRNCFIPFFSGVPFQIGFQEMKDDKSRDFMKQYMVPNSRDYDIDGIRKATIRGTFTKADFDMLCAVFEDKAYLKEESIKVTLNPEQSIAFVNDKQIQVELHTNSNAGMFIEIENIKIYC